MEFFYEEQAVANEEASDVKHDEKTEEVFHKFEDEVTRQYQRTTDALKHIVKEDEQGVKLNLPLDSEVSETAQRYLKQLDSNLHNVENLALNYWSQVSDAGFWPSMTSKLGSKLEQIVKIDEPTSKSEQSLQSAAGGNRTEAELKALSTDKAIYLNYESKSSEDFDADAKTDEIARILEQDKNMANLMNNIVPAEITYKEFWRIYFDQRQKILDMENKRKRLLAGQKTEEEEVGWDDEEADAAEEEPVIVKKEDTIGEKVSDETAGTTKIEEEAKGNIDEQQEDDEEDDDWE